MPVNQKLMRSLRKEYGGKKGEDIYYAMENKSKHTGKLRSAFTGSKK